jgi:ribosomal protein S10
MVFFIKISSKNKATLQLFLMFISKLENNNLLLKYFPKQKIKKFITVLKSPHVNKSAQEQFEFRVYTKKLRVSSPQHLKFLYFLKKSQTTIFPFINLKLEGIYSVKSQLNLISSRLDPNKLNSSFFTKSKFKKNMKKQYFRKSLIKYFNLLDCYGEYRIKKLINQIEHNQHL